MVAKMILKPVNFPKPLIDQTQEYAEKIAPDGERPNFSDAVRQLCRIALASVNGDEE